VAELAVGIFSVLSVRSAVKKDFLRARQSFLMNMQQLVIPAKAGIQDSANTLKILDSRLHGNDEIMPFFELLRVHQKVG
jgi:hypothetical protein